MEGDGLVDTLALSDVVIDTELDTVSLVETLLVTDIVSLGVPVILELCEDEALSDEDSLAVVDALWVDERE